MVISGAVEFLTPWEQLRHPVPPSLPLSLSLPRPAAAQLPACHPRPLHLARSLARSLTRSRLPGHPAAQPSAAQRSPAQPSGLPAPLPPPSTATTGSPSPLAPGPTPHRHPPPRATCRSFQPPGSNPPSTTDPLDPTPTSYTQGRQSRSPTGSSGTRPACPVPYLTARPPAQVHRCRRGAGQGALPHPSPRRHPASVASPTLGQCPPAPHVPGPHSTHTPGTPSPTARLGPLLALPSFRDALRLCPDPRGRRRAGENTLVPRYPPPSRTPRTPTPTHTARGRGEGAEGTARADGKHPEAHGRSSPPPPDRGPIQPASRGRLTQSAGRPLRLRRRQTVSGHTAKPWRAGVQALAGRRPGAAVHLQEQRRQETRTRAETGLQALLPRWALRRQGERLPSGIQLGRRPRGAGAGAGPGAWGGGSCVGEHACPSAPGFGVAVVQLD